MANAKYRAAKKCPKGHVMDPNWDQCSYCRAEKRAKKKTGRAKIEVVDSSDNHRTKVVKRPQKAVRRETKRMPEMATPGSGDDINEDDTRRIVGILVTYDWHPGGKLFAVREGKNYIGSGKLSSEAIHRRCDVYIPQDEEMSSEHALILCRQGINEIIDQATTNGTEFNGKMLPANQSTTLKNYAKIRTGRTTWTFIETKATPESKTEPHPKDTQKSSPKTTEVKDPTRKAY